VQFGKALGEAKVMTKVLDAQKEQLLEQQADIKKQIASRDATREQEYERERRDFYDAKADADARRRRAEEQWEQQKSKELADLESSISRQQAVVDQGGYKSYVTRTHYSGWWIFGRYHTHVDTEYSLKPAQEQLESLRKAREQLSSRANPCDSNPDRFKNPPKREDYFYKTWLEEEEEKLKQKDNEVAEELKKYVNQLQAEEEKLEQKDKECKHAFSVWTDAKKELEEQLSTDSSAYQVSIINAYKAGMNMASATNSMGFGQSVSASNLGQTLNGLSVALNGIMRGKTAEKQLNRLSKVQKMLGTSIQDCDKAAICLQWLSKVAGQFLPLPAPKYSAEAGDLALQLMKKNVEEKRAALKDGGEADEPPEWID